MNAELRVDCKCCIEDIILDITIRGNKLTSIKDIREMAEEQGWHIGRDCYCPDCYKDLPAHCSTCQHYEGNKSMGAALCRKDGEFALPGDYCENYTPFHGACVTQDAHGYQNPTPTVTTKMEE